MEDKGEWRWKVGNWEFKERKIILMHGFGKLEIGSLKKEKLS